MTIVQKEISDRSTFGKIVKWAFIIFNLFMIFALYSGCSAASDVPMSDMSDAEQAGAAIGTTLGVGMLMAFWVMGDIILGIVVLLTRRKKLVQVEE